MLDFFEKVGDLKRLLRKGWVLRHIPNPESVADHSFRLALLALVLTPKSGLSRERCVYLALIHDLAESLVGDITPHDGISPEEKIKREDEAMKCLSQEAQDPSLYALWEEYRDQHSAESKWIHDLDKFEMVLQAHEYEKSSGCDLSEFWAYASKPFSQPILANLYQELLERRMR